MPYTNNSARWAMRRTPHGACCTVNCELSQRLRRSRFGSRASRQGRDSESQPLSRANCVANHAQGVRTGMPRRRRCEQCIRGTGGSGPWAHEVEEGGGSRPARTRQVCGLRPGQVRAWCGQGQGDGPCVCVAEVEVRAQQAACAAHITIRRAVLACRIAIISSMLYFLPAAFCAAA